MKKNTLLAKSGIVELPEEFLNILKSIYVADKGGLEGKKFSVEAVSALYQLYKNYHPQPLVIETDEKGIITYINEQFASAAEYSPEELIGKPASVFKSENTPPGTFQQMWLSITQGKVWREIIENRSKTRKRFWIDMCIIPIMNSQGENVRFLGVAYDITQEKLKELDLERKNNEMMESLKYAKRIQKVFLPTKKLLNEFLPEHFVSYKPKDVVSGDFYWAALTVDKGFVAVVDCTGHGVPGALMSIIGHNLLNEIVMKDRIYDPGKILTELHKRVRKTLQQDKDRRSRDGMDLTLIAIERYTNIIHFAGANNSAYWWKEKEQILERVKGDKKSIGGEQLEKERIFTTQTLEVHHKDCFYMFSDGIPDQFGGPDDKKFSKKRLKQLLIDIHEHPMRRQRALFNEVWKDWKGDREQTDDATIIGIKFVFDEEEE